MYFSGGFWAEELSPREHCYRIVPLDNGMPEAVMNEDWDRLYQALGKLNYRFRDGGHSSEFIIVSLSTPISDDHKKHLADCYSIAEDDGMQLSFA